MSRRYDDNGRCPRCGLTNQEVTAAIFDHYGWICACCGEDNPGFLTLDHMDDSGKRDRELHRGNFKHFVVERALRTGFWPANLQTLCFNCNCGRNKNGGVCPHVTIEYLTLATRND